MLVVTSAMQKIQQDSQGDGNCGKQFPQEQSGQQGVTEKAILKSSPGGGGGDTHTTPDVRTTGLLEDNTGENISAKVRWGIIRCNLDILKRSN